MVWRMLAQGQPYSNLTELSFTRYNNYLVMRLVQRVLPPLPLHHSRGILATSLSTYHVRASTISPMAMHAATLLLYSFRVAIRVSAHLP